MRSRRTQVAWVYAGLWAAVGAAAAVCAAVPGATALVRTQLGLTLNGSSVDRVRMVATIALHNECNALWPIALALLGLARNEISRRTIDRLVTASLATNAGVVGLAIAAYGSPLLPFLVHLPAELLGLALGAAGWWSSAESSDDRRTRSLCNTCAASCSLVLLIAAWLEVYLTPH